MSVTDGTVVEGTEPVQPESQGQESAADPTVQTPAATPAPAIQGGQGPWANDLSTMFQDEAIRGQVDGFLREKVQPHVTRLEQERSQYEPARALYDDLTQDTVPTYLAITEELFGPEFAQTLKAQIDAGDEPAPGQPDEPTAQQPTRDPEVEALLQERREAQQAEAYNALVAQAKQIDPTINEELVHPFLAAADGDPQKAVTAYQNFVSNFGTPAEPEPDPAAPTVIGTGSTGGAAPPVQKHYDSLDEALDDTLADMRSARAAPTVVGAV